MDKEDMPTEIQNMEGLINSKDAVDVILGKVDVASRTFRTMDQKKVDTIFHRVAIAATINRVHLAQMAVEEGGMGNIEDKTMKNHFAAEFVHYQYRDTKTCGVVEGKLQNGHEVVAEPVGIVAASIPCTNPTSATIFKALLALKSRNCVIFAPHPRTAKATVNTARLLRDAAVEAGAPENCIAWIDVPQVELCQYVMQHPLVNMVVATGTGGLVRGTGGPNRNQLGQGGGNTPAVIDETANIQAAVNCIMQSKTFDNGMLCGSEQAVIVVESIMSQVREEFTKRGAYFMTEDEKTKVASLIIQDEGRMNPSVVGQTASKVAQMAGLAGVPEGVRLLLCVAKEIGKMEKLSYEKLCPCLPIYVVPDFDSAIESAVQVIKFGGQAQAACLYTDQSRANSRARIEAFEQRVPTHRVLVSMPAYQGVIEDVADFGDEQQAENARLHLSSLLNFKHVNQKRSRIMWFKAPPVIYFSRNILSEALCDLERDGLKRAFVVTDEAMKRLGYVNQLTNALTERNMEVEVFWEVKPDPDDVTVLAGVERMKIFRPDLVVSFGGGSPIDASKIMRVLYEHPEITIPELYTRFMDIRKRIIKFPDGGKLVKKMVCIPTTSGTGAEITPFAVIKDAATSVKYPIASYRLTPDIAILDAEFVMSMPKSHAAYTGYDALTHAVESYVSIVSTDYSQSLSMRAIQMVFKNLSISVNNCTIEAREAMHNASSIAGMAFANAFLGICHSMAHQLGGMFQIPHGLCNAMVMCQVAKFNASESPAKQGPVPEYIPSAKRQYAEIADGLNITKGCITDEEKVDRFIEALTDLKKEISIPTSIRAHGIPEADYMKHVDEMALHAFDDQCTGCNPRFPLVSELRQLYIDAYYGDIKSYDVCALH